MKNFLKKIKAMHIIWLAVSVVLLAVAIVATCVCNYYSAALVAKFGRIGEGGSSSVKYFDSNYNDENGDLDLNALTAAQDALNLQIAEEGAVLLENDVDGDGNAALPLSTESGKNKVSVFSIASRAWLTSGTGSGSVSTDSGMTVKSSLEDAGLIVNPDLWNFYGTMTKYGRTNGTDASNGNKVGTWSIGEVPQSEYTNEVKSSYSSYNDAAVIILTRSGGEGGDLPRDMTYYDESNTGHYLELDDTEKAMFSAVNAAFDKVIVVINSANAFQMDFLSNYSNIKGVVWMPGTGGNGLEALGEILTGKVNPSGRLVDTYVYDNFSAPAMQNFGWNIYTQSGSNTDYSFVNYAEGIYVDYKYYETRYEDSVLKAADSSNTEAYYSNVGTYDYSNTVYAPFGYGLSYTDYTYSDYALTLADGTAITSATEITADTELKASVTVTNTGSMAGRNTVEFYYQSPYTSYDQTNGVEKSAVELLGFYKTDTLAANGTETASVTFKASDLKSYDSKTAKTYILDIGDYYITAATDAHNAVNNILLAKQTSDNQYTLSGTGDAALAAKVTISGTESEPIKVSSSVGGTEVTNEFDGCSIDSATYLSRSNWAVMDSATVSCSKGIVTGPLSYATTTTTFTSGDSKTGTTGRSPVTATAGAREVTSDTLAALQASGWSNSGRPSSADDDSDVLFSQSGEYTYTDENGAEQTVNLDMTYMTGASYDDERWTTVVQMMKIAECRDMFQTAGYSTKSVASINCPATADYDGPSGLTNYISGQGAYSYCCEVLIAATWDTDIALRFGKLVGEDGLRNKIAGWYAPAANIHRTPFSGRNFEYYSADALLSGKMAAQTIKGAQSMGMFSMMKHFALNDQESFRLSFGDVSTWAGEQAIRETYLKAFEIGVEEGGTHGIMTAMNRIGAKLARGNYNLITNVLRGEWGFEGTVITDYVNDDKSTTDQVLAAGGDLMLNTGACSLSDTSGNVVRHALQEAAHHTLFAVANSLAMNGLETGSTYSAGFAVYNFIIIALWVAFAAVIIVWAVFIFRKKKVKDLTKKESEQQKAD